MTALANKAVYVRGPDDVFRRKSEDGNVTKTQVDTFINELMECGFRVAPEPDTASKKEKPQDLSGLMDPKRPDPGALQGKQNQLRSAPNLRPLPRLNTDLSLATILPRSGSPVTCYSHASADVLECVPDKLTSEANCDGEPAAKTFMEGFEAYRQKFGDAGLDKVKAWAPPFVLGMITTYVLQQMQPLLMYYGVIVAHLLKLFIVWLVFTGSVCWYFGVLSLPAGSEYVQKAQALMGQLPVVFNQKGGATPHTPSRAEVFSQAEAHPDADQVIAKAPSLPKKESHEDQLLPTSVVNVMPFKAPKRETFRRANTDDPRSNHTRDSRKHSDTGSPRLAFIQKTYKRPQSSSPVHSGGRSDRRHSSSSLPLDKDPRLRKPLPQIVPTTQPNPDSELPFICEMKLRPKTEGSGYDNPPRADLKRSGTYMSQKSVLGTRANYAKFIANFDE
ncbi:hypothetical protein PUMCH_000541 [Australozyma saopauloensis]|uniref:Uncharacterized protein n=1 Tax=Australozyma saopauloensis TaxID=291208 RepID=A0AAX4H3Z4_9ASCO|nr:hypothetical protein PUMCH_000541 [[Candida] saopauloensis]